MTVYKLLTHDGHVYKVWAEDAHEALQKAREMASDAGIVAINFAAVAPWV